VTRIRVATFNVRNGLGLDGRNCWPLRRATTARTIAALDADAVALQEVYAFQQRYLERRLGRYRFVAAGRTDGVKGERCPVLADAATTRVVAVRHMWFGPTPERPGTQLPGATFPRLATTASLVVGEDERRVDVTSTHLDEASAERRRSSAAQLAASLDLSVPQVVMGDLNADPGSDVLAELEAVGLTVVVPGGDDGTEHRFTGRTDGRRIDHILVSAPFRVVDSRVATVPLGPVLASDHFPVLAVLDL
jgi:endonuclease/exonuclease/phosphatase family metal-dependent hydrolase